MSSAAHYPGSELELLADTVNYPRWIVERFRPYFGETVAEVGAGIGTISKLILASGATRLLAFEPSTNLFAKLSEEMADEPRCVSINDYFCPERAAGCDSVAYVNVLEHIEDDASELRRAYESLRPRGHLLVFVPAHEWLYSEFDRGIGHCRRYTKRGLQELVREAGFELVSLRYFDLAGIIPWYVNFVLLKNRPKRSSVRLYDRLVVPLMRRVESVVAPPIGKNLLLVARKPAEVAPEIPIELGR
jgi:SAM-dependent methyltransferase